MILPDRVTKLVLVLLLVASPALAQGQIADDAAPEKAPDPTFIVGEPEGVPLTGEALEARTVEVSSLLRCPTCQGLSINDSPATMARNMKAQTRELLARGYSGEQVLTYFERAYGEFVRLEPPKRGVNWLVWLSPVAFLVIGFFFVRGVLAKMSTREPMIHTTTAGPLTTDRDRLPEDEELARYVLLARELVHGRPGGEATGAEQENE